MPNIKSLITRNEPFLEWIGSIYGIIFHFRIKLPTFLDFTG